jgi:23S rRNA pseudouridine2605 synthase
VERQQGDNQWLTVGLREGKNREVKVVLGALGLQVNRLIRISYGPFQLGELESRRGAGGAHARAQGPAFGQGFQGRRARFRRTDAHTGGGRDTPARPDKARQDRARRIGQCAVAQRPRASQAASRTQTRQTRVSWRGPARPKSRQQNGSASAGPPGAARKRRAAGRRPCGSSQGPSKARTLKAPSSQAVRPTTDRAREALFNILAHNGDDLFAEGRGS